MHPMIKQKKEVNGLNNLQNPTHLYYSRSLELLRWLIYFYLNK